jgi:hypothetical protein
MRFSNDSRPASHGAALASTSGAALVACPWQAASRPGGDPGDTAYHMSITMSPKSLSADLSDDCESGLGLRSFTEAPTGSSGAFSSTLLRFLASC